MRPATQVAQEPEPPSLRIRMLQHVMLPLILTWLIGTIATLAVASHFTEEAFDRALLDDAWSIASQVGVGADGSVGLQLTPSELSAALFDQAESVYFAVQRADGTPIAGAPLPKMASPGPDQGYRYGNFVFAGQPVRAVNLRHEVAGEPYHIVMAHTTRIRGALVNQLMLYGALPLLLALVLLALWLWHGIDRDLRPLAELQKNLARRDAQDLRPVPPSRSTREISELSQAANALLARLELSLRSQREFAGNVAHELRTPLARIRALADYDLAHPDARISQERLRQIATSAESAGRLVNQLLDLALADEGEVSLKRERLALAPLVGQAILRHLDRADTRQVDFGARGLDDADADDALVRAVPELVEGILDNLIANAQRYGGATVTVELAASSDGQAWVLAVIDDGPGIAEAARRTLMQRWTQGRDGELLGEGAGLGLSIVARYARVLGSALHLDCGDNGRGLRASVSLPRA